MTAPIEPIEPVEPAEAAEPISLRLPATSLVIGALSAGFFFWMAGMSAATGQHAMVTLGTALCFAALGVVALLMVADYYLARHVLTEDAIDAGRRFGGRRVMRWDAVRRLRFSPTLKWFVLEDQTGRKVRVSTSLSGLPEFARVALERVPEAALDKKTQRLLSETRLGRRPRVWI